MSQESKHLLVVDDNESHREVMERFLGSKGFIVSTASGGEEALILIDAQRFDLVLLDILMPDIGGLDVLEKIRQKHSVADLPVILVTVKDQTDDIVEGLKRGANDYIIKPVDFQVALARIQTHLRLHQMQEEIVAQKEFNENLIESAYEMIISVSLDRKITSFNKAAIKSFGYSPDEILGKHVDVLYEDPEQGIAIHNKVLREDGFTGEVVNKRKDGTTFYSTLSSSILRDKNNNPIGIMGVSLDRTEQKKMEEERRKLASLKEEFLRIASHELKNPLTGIIGYASLIQRTLTPGKEMTDEMHEAAGKIMRLAEVMHHIVVDFLEFEAMEDGEVKTIKEKVDLNEIVKRVVEQYMDYAGTKKAALVSDLDPDLPIIKADPVRIEQVLSNMVNNALKFGGEENKVVITTHAYNRGVRLEVSDRGPGLSEEDMPRLFIKYARMSARPTGGERSSGLGLAICKKIIDMHKGEIGGENNPEGGATFWFTLPAS